MKVKIFFLALTTALAFLLISSARGFAAKGEPGPPGDTGEEVGNNMSVPAVLTDNTTGGILAYWEPPDAGVEQLCVHYSYGCDKGETVDHFSYPNTSCVETLMVPQDELVCLTAAECNAPGGKCEGYPLSRVYWQKEALNNWSADQDAIDGGTDAAFVDWGDALEAVSWNERSIIRVETQPYAELFEGFIDTTAGTVGPCNDKALAFGLLPDDVCRVGFQMWHVSGQGITEHWGVRATEDAVSYNYDSPYQIINTSTARLNLAKMEAATTECPSPGSGEEGEEEVEAAVLAAEPPVLATWTVAPDGSGSWDGACTWRDAPYSVELSVGGKYVYGFNWRMKNVELSSLCPGFSKTGWWRLTFYTSDNAIGFADGNMPVSAPPAVPAEARDLELFAYNTVVGNYEPSTSELYVPVVDPANNLTYIDICIVSKTKGGGGGKPEGRAPDHGIGRPGGDKGGGSGGGGYGGGGGGKHSTATS